MLKYCNTVQYDLEACYLAERVKSIMQMCDEQHTEAESVDSVYTFVTGNVYFNKVNMNL